MIALLINYFNGNIYIYFYIRRIYAIFSLIYLFSNFSFVSIQKLVYNKKLNNIVSSQITIKSFAIIHKYKFSFIFEFLYLCNKSQFNLVSSQNLCTFFPPMLYMYFEKLTSLMFDLVSLRKKFIIISRNNRLLNSKLLSYYTLLYDAKVLMRYSWFFLFNTAYLVSKKWSFFYYFLIKKLSIQICFLFEPIRDWKKNIRHILTNLIIFGAYSISFSLMNFWRFFNFKRLNFFFFFLTYLVHITLLAFYKRQQTYLNKVNNILLFNWR